MVYKALEMVTRWSLFRRARPSERTWDIIAWWESRRIPYNLIVGAAGIASAIVMLMCGFVTEHVVGEAIGVPGSPFFAIVAVVVYGIMAIYVLQVDGFSKWLVVASGGTRAEAFGEIAFTWGTLCSVLLTLVPAAITVVVGSFRIVADGWKH